jgi:WD40 repeat protein
LDNRTKSAAPRSARLAHALAAAAWLLAVGTAGCGVGGELEPSEKKPVVYYYALSYAPERNRIAVGGDGGVMLFDALTGAKLGTIDPGNGAAMIVREAGNMLAAALLGNLWLFDAAGAARRTIEHPYQVYSLALSPDGGTVASGDVAGRIRRFRTADGTEIVPALVPNSGDFVNDVKISPDGTYLAAAVVEGARVWGMADGALVAEIPGRADRLAWTPDSRELAVVGDTQVAVFGIPAAEQIRSYPVGGVVVRPAYSSDGRKLALSAENNTVAKIFDTATGAELVTLFDHSETRPPEQPGFRDISELAFIGAQNDRVAVAWRSGRLAEWRTDDGTLVFSRLDSDQW